MPGSSPLTVFVVAVGVAAIASEFFQISVAMGAFFAGLVVGQSKIGPQAAADMTPPHVVAMELDLRGQTGDEALPTVEQYLDDAFRAGMESARIIHGKGTGALRRIVRDFVAKHALVKSYEEAPREYGGEGVTIVHLAL